MTALMANVVSQIAEHHKLASALLDQMKPYARDATDHARQAGLLLLKVKAEVGHGKFGDRLITNLDFTSRTAHRYMNVAAPKRKNDKLSYSSQPPKPGSKQALQMTRVRRVIHRQEVVAHMFYLAAELPAADALLEADLVAAMALRDALNKILEANHG